MNKVLFLTKIRQNYGFLSKEKKHSGLFNSTRFIVEALNDLNIHSKIVEVVDANSIDKEVHHFRPTVVVIEAFWATPEKFKELKKLHPKVHWYVHLHSNVPFLAIEGVAIKWMNEYVDLGVGIITNSPEIYYAFVSLLGRLIFLPNIYLMKEKLEHAPICQWGLNIACFGAIRPMKNQLIQALAAIRFAEEKRMGFTFHMNGTRVEGGGEPVLKNLKNLLGECLSLHLWHEPSEFLFLLREMDLGMQVSLSETFNVVTADYVTASLPVVVSDQINWVHGSCQAKSDSVADIVKAMHRVYENEKLVRKNQSLLQRLSDRAVLAWQRFIDAH